MSTVDVRAIESESNLLEDVMRLHRADSHRLGFFPRGAFEDHARARQILLALNEQNDVLGYLLYRVAKQRAIIAHLCTSPSARNKGVARLLVEHLKRVTKPLAGIGLHCRQDYDARHVWAKFGFTALNRKAGRSQDGHELTFWWFDHGHPDLFSLAGSTAEPRQRVVVDANVFFDLQSLGQRDSEDSKALLADWVQATIELCITKELFNEIDRATDATLRARSKAALTYYPVLKTDDARFQEIRDQIKNRFPAAAVLRDESDLRQIAYAIAGGASYFVTRDRELAERCDQLYEHFGFQVLHPAELISSLDMIERESQYHPACIEGSHLRSYVVTSEEVDYVVEAFRDATERASDFRKELLHCLSKPREIEAKYVADHDLRPIFLGVLHRGRNDILEVKLLRTGKHSLAATLLRNFLRRTLEVTTQEGRRLVAISDMTVTEATREALIEFGFVKSKGEWVKISFRSIGDFATLRDVVRLSSTFDAGEPLADYAQLTIDAGVVVHDAVAAAAMESRFWPAKVVGANLPTYLISIRSEWAQHFFDDALASQFLFGTRDELLLGIEGVYYCSAKHRHLTAPARVLWYVSKGSDGTGSMTVKACSRLEELVIGKPKELFKRFRRIGVYQWVDVFQAAKEDINNDILAFRFTMTERFTKPFTLEQLEKLKICQPFLAPRRLSDTQFATIYSYGRELK